MKVNYNNKYITNNEYLKVSETQNKPQIILNNTSFKKILIMYDPDAYGGTHIHWSVSDIMDDVDKGNILIPYKGPAPPPKTGKHRYIFELYKQNLPNHIRITERVMPIEKLRAILALDKPIENIQFISQNESGGRRRKTKKRKQRRTFRKNKITKRNNKK
jgi:hypothetical protein